MSDVDKWGLRITSLVLSTCAAVLMLSFAVRPATSSDLEERVRRLEETQKSRGELVRFAL